MPWKLKIYNSTRTVLKKTITNATPGVSNLIHQSGFKWQTRNKDCIQMQLTVKNSALGLQAHDVLQLLVDGKPEFFGVALEVPSPRSQNFEQVTILGGKELLKKRVTGTQVFQNASVYSIALSLLQDHIHPAIQLDESLIGTPGENAVLGTYYEPNKALWDVLEGLEKTLPVQRYKTGVDAQGRVFFHAPEDPETEIPYTTQPFKFLPIAGQDTVSKAILQIATSAGGTQQPDVLLPRESPTLPYRGEPYLPAPISVTAESPLHNQYGMERTFTVPEGKAVIKPFIPAFQDTSGVSNPSGAFDGNPETFTTITPPAGSLHHVTAQSTETDHAVGFRLVYDMNWSPSAASNVSVEVFVTSWATESYLYAQVNLPKTVGRTEVYVVVPPDVRTATAGPTFLVVRVGTTDAGLPANTLKIYSLELLQVDMDLAQALAESFLTVPASLPTEITLQGTQSVGDTITITGAPGGDASGRTEMVEKTLSGKEQTTIVRLGSRGASSEAREIRLTAENAARKASEDALRFINRR